MQLLKKSSPPDSFDEEGGFSARKILVALVLVIGLAGGCFIIWGPGLEMIQTWRAQSHLKEAKSLFAKKEWEDAMEQADHSFKERPTLEAARLATHAAYRIKNPEVISNALRLFRFEGATAKDRALALQIAVDFRELQFVEKMVKDLDSQDLKDPDIRLQLVRGSLKVRNIGQALAIAQLGQEGEDPEIDFLLATELARGDGSTLQGELVKRLRNLIRCDDPDLSIKALDLLISAKSLWQYGTLVDEAIDRFSKRNDLTLLQQLHLKSFSAQSGFQSLDANIREAISKHWENDLKTLLDWLANLERYEDILELTEDPEVQNDQEIFSLRLSALDQLEDWAAFKKALESPPEDMPKAMRFALQYQVACIQGRIVDSRSLWASAIAEALSDREMNWFYHLSSVAERVNNQDDHMVALTNAILHEVGTPPKTRSLKPLFDWLEQNRDEVRLLAVSEKLLQWEPNHPLLLNQSIYLRTLNGDGKEEDFETVRKLTESFPDHPKFHRSLALLQVIHKKYQEALMTLDRIEGMDEKLDQSLKEIRARALYALGQKEQAR